MKLSVGMPPGPAAAGVRAARRRTSATTGVWLYDSAALYEDIWIWLARLAEHTDIDLGTAVLVPNLRHVMTTASAIATIERMAPGRLACGFGTGATARWVLNQNGALVGDDPPLPRAAARACSAARSSRSTVEQCQMIHHPDWAAGTPDRHAAAALRARAQGQADRRPRCTRRA